MKKFQMKIGIHVDLTDAIGRNVAIGAYETNEIAFMKSRLAKGDTLLDVGGNIGTFALVGSWCVGPTGRVITIEALSHNVASLHRSVAQNDFARNVTVVQALVAERESADAFIGYQTLKDGSGNSGGGALVSADETLPAHVKRERVAQTTLDAIVGPEQPVSFIKIDVEGAEILAFRGAARLLETRSPIIMSEVHTDQLRKISGGDWRDYFRLMSGYGYEAFMLEGATIGRPASALQDGEIYNVVFIKS